jgi:hypothetical protein
MSFQLNNEQQMAINDSLLSLTERELKYLKDSWAERPYRWIQDRLVRTPQSQAKFQSKSQTFFHSCKTKKLKFISSLLESFSSACALHADRPETWSINFNYSRIMNHAIQYGRS